MRNDFPLLQNNPGLVYLDSAATALKPLVVLEAEQMYSTHFGTNAVRGLYPLAEKTNLEVEATRQAVADFIGAAKDTIIFTSGTTAGINMLAHSYGSTLASGNGEVVVSVDAHHSLIIPWQELATRMDWTLITAPVNKEGSIDAKALIASITPKTKVVALTLVSNVYGVMNDLKNVIASIKEKNPACFIVVDAAQAVAHMPINVADLVVDALVFSGHKLYGPTGIGVCYLATNWQEKLAPSQFGGGMVLDTSVQPTVWKTGPEKFEAGTLPLSQIFGLKKAVQYVTAIGFPHIKKHESELLIYATEKLLSTFGKHISFLGTSDTDQKIGLLSFTLAGVHPHDIATLLGEKNICVRAGEHCASFLHRSLHLPATTRISFGLYTTKSDIDIFVTALQETYTLLSH
jgi:cysteine desulfurase/selenocysteine lyase